MAREFAEETGYGAPVGWRHFCELANPCDGTIVDFFHGEGPLAELRTTTDERLELYSVGALPPDVIGQLRWLISLALDRDIDLVRVVERGGRR